MKSKTGRSVKSDAERPLVFLDFDGVLLMPRYPPERENEADFGGAPLSELDEFPWLRNGPADLEWVELNGLGGWNVRGVVRRDVISGMQELASEAVEVMWATSWLTEPDKLRSASSILGLEFIHFPELGDIQAENRPMNGRYSAVHWKTELVLGAVERGRRVLWVDDQIERTFPRKVLSRLSVIAPSMFYGLSLTDVRHMRRWADGADLARFQYLLASGWDIE